MSKQIIRAVMALLVSFLFCATAQAGYPTSNDAYKHTWGEMGANPYVGMPEEGCLEIGYTEVQCAEYIRRRNTVQCQYMDVPTDGSVVLDKLLFGNNVVQEDVLVALEKYSTLRSLVCELDGDAIISFDGCSNLAVVEDWSFEKAPAPKFSARPYQDPRNVCPLDNSRYQQTSILEEAALGDECAQRLVNVKGPNGIDGERLSRTCGPSLHATYRPGILNHGMEIVFIPDGQPEGNVYEYSIFQGSILENVLTAASGYEDMVVVVAGQYLVRLPDEIDADGVIVDLSLGTFETRFGDYGKLYSPRPVHLSERGKTFTRGCVVTLAVAIEKVGDGEQVAVVEEVK